MSVDQTAPVAPDARTRWHDRRLPVIALIPLAAVVWWVVGFLPWIVDGMGWQLSDGNHFLGAAHPMLPMMTGNVGRLLVGGLVGGLAAGALVWCGRGGALARVGAVSAGAVLALLVTVIQSRSTLSGSFPDSFVTDSWVLGGLGLVVVLATVAGSAFGVLSLAGRPGLGFTLAIVAGAGPPWLVDLFATWGVDAQSRLGVMPRLTQWVGAALLALALIVLGARPAMRLLAWPFAVLCAWLIGPTVTAAVYLGSTLRPGAGLPDTLPDHLSAAMQVWRAAISPEMRPLTPWIVALIAAVAVVFWGAATRSRSSSA